MKKTSRTMCVWFLGMTYGISAMMIFETIHTVWIAGIINLALAFLLSMAAQLLPYHR